MPTLTSIILTFTIFLTRPHAFATSLSLSLSLTFQPDPDMAGQAG